MRRASVMLSVVMLLGSLMSGGDATAQGASPVTESGEKMARCVGFFSAAAVESTFDQPIMPFGTQVGGTLPTNAAAA